MKEYSADKVEHVLTVQNEIGESPIWVPEENRLYWTDTEDSAVFSYSLESRQVRKYTLSMPVTALVRRRGGGWMLITKKGLAFWDPNANICEFIVDPVAGNESMAFNDGTADPAGRLIAGTMNFNELTAPDGCIYSLDSNLRLRELDSNICVANGIGFSPDGKTLYVSEQWNSKILAYDYDPETGNVSGRRIFADVDPEEGYPDGIVVDSEGFLWNGRWGGARIVRYSPDGSTDRVYRLPVEVGTCAGFGGADMKTLFIATAWYGMNMADRKKNPMAGDLLCIQTDVVGNVERRFEG
jgi:L-arabinonolactonase